MMKVTERLPEMPKEDSVLRVAAYCRVSTDHEEQDGSLEFQKLHYMSIIEDNPCWISVGILAEKASGLNIKDRLEFQRLLRLCRQGMVNLILTKSISRFGRNTLETLRVLQVLNELDVDVYFELEDMHLRGQQMQFALSVFCVFAQEESESRSRNIRWGIRQGFRTGISRYADFVCYGYQLYNGKLRINEVEATVVRQIFELRAVGASLGKISESLYAQGIRSPNGRPRWSRETIRKILMNEKYTGDVLLQKSYVADLFSGIQVRNSGERAKYLIENHHPAIISCGLFNRVQAKSS